MKTSRRLVVCATAIALSLGLIGATSKPADQGIEPDLRPIPKPRTTRPALTPLADSIQESTLHAFTFAEGRAPVASMIADRFGDLYGTLQLGGSTIDGTDGCGTVFELRSSSRMQRALPPRDSSGWQAQVLYVFTGVNGDGCLASGGLVADPHGNLYGTTETGGASFTCGPYREPCGAIYELSPPVPGQSSWTEKIIYSFTGGSDGSGPTSALTFDMAGSLIGSSNSAIFRLSPPSASRTAWTLTTLHTFAGGSTDGAYPSGSPILDRYGNIFGTTVLGGIANGGVVYELLNGSYAERILHVFGGRSDGLEPTGGVTLDSAGNLYGTTSSGGSSPNCPVLAGGCGIVYRLTPRGETILHTFTNANGDGAESNAPLTIDGSGNLYGTTTYGGINGLGTVFEASPPSYDAHTVYSFVGGASGGQPLAGLTPLNGAFYGLANSGGIGNGVAFKLVPPAKAFWRQTPL